ncbi:BTAD domain-containing putative transcriptional regulator [Dactylosporangium sp. NPDC050588]|uniref:AfsR/SARP family transcriptional regulator n=1 Tax=Dactylosporangium sp. NPDC050588 TaxID=3157211 RepID=UPI0033EE3FDC
MKFRILGPLELVCGGDVVNIGGPRLRVVLAMLALNANRVTPVNSLIEAVWEQDEPTTARAQIQICISALRKHVTGANGTATIRTRPGGYMLEIPDADLDRTEFAARVQEARKHADAGRLAEASTALQQALALWRGNALSDVDSPLVLRGAAQLEEDRLSAIQELARLDLELGRHHEIGGALATLVAEHPLRERLYELLMLALYRSGRQAEALEVSRRARATLIDELGIEPGAALQHLERAILNRDPALEAHAGAPPAEQSTAPAAPRRVGPELTVLVPNQLPRSIADFTGREAEIAEITRILTGSPGQGDARYAMPIVALAGKGGVGKSCLAVRVAHELSDRFPDGLLYADLQHPTDEDLTGALLTRFLRALGVPGSAIPDDVEERAELYRSRLAHRRVLVVLDDVSAEEQMQRLLPGSPTCAVIATSRMRLSGLPGAHLVDVDVFDTANSMRMLSKIIGPIRVEAEEQSALALIDFCDGLPLALRIAGARLAFKRHWRLETVVARLDDEAHRLDEFSHRGLELRSTIGLTYRVLSPRCQRLFRLFALIEAPDFPGWTAAALLDSPLREAEDVLEQLVDAQLLDTVEYPGERIRYRFHTLIRAYALERLAEQEPAQERDDALCRVLGAWLGLAEDAYRKDHGGDFNILHGTAPRWRIEGVELDIIGSPLEWWETERRALVAAVRQAAATGLDELCWDIALTSAGLFEVKGYFSDWQETTELGLAAAELAGNRIGRAAMLYSLGCLHMVQKRLAEARHCFDTALTIFRGGNHVHGCALVLRESGIVDRHQGRFAEMLDKFQQARRLLQHVGDATGEAHVLQSLAGYWVEEGDTVQAHEHLTRALELCLTARHLRGEAQVMHRFAELYLRTDQVELARQSLHRALLIVRDLGDRIGECYTLYGLGVVRHQEGRLDQAQTTLQHALSLARELGERMVEAKALYALGEIVLARGAYSAAATHLLDAAHLLDELDSAMWHGKTLSLLAEVHRNQGEFELARVEIEQAKGVLTDVSSRDAAYLLVQLETTRAALEAEQITR